MSSALRRPTAFLFVRRVQAVDVTVALVRVRQALTRSLSSLTNDIPGQLTRCVAEVRTDDLVPVTCGTKVTLACLSGNRGQRDCAKCNLPCKFQTNPSVTFGAAI